MAVVVELTLTPLKVPGVQAKAAPDPPQPAPEPARTPEEFTWRHWVDPVSDWNVVAPETMRAEVEAVPLTVMAVVEA